MSAAQRAKIAEPLAEAFASTFVWGLVLLAVAFIPALAMALGKWKPVGPPSPDERHVVLE
jgi:DMSO/TMAO reductase YedYZ heme-binding membrane subunit